MRLFVRLRALAATVLLVAILLGFPVLFYGVAGDPFPDHVPDLSEITQALTARDDGTLFIAVLKLVAWGAWAVFTLSVLGEVVARARGREFAPRLPGIGAVQRLAAHLVASATLALTVPTLMAAGSAPPVSTMAPLHPLAEASTAEAISTPQRVHHVQDGETLWEIADEELGSPLRWPKIWKLNAHSEQPGGRTFTDPDVIHPGWNLKLPGQPATAPTPEESVAPDPPNAVTSQVQDHQIVGAIELPSGSLIAMAYAAGISTAYAINRMRRRRRRQLPAASVSVAITPEQQPSKEVQQLRNAHRREFIRQTAVPLADSELLKEQYSIDVPHRTTVGRRDDGSFVELDITGCALGLSGRGALDVIRYLILDLLRQSSSFRTEVVLHVDLGVVLLEVSADELYAMARHLPGLLVTPTAQGALKHLAETHFGRSRMLLEREAMGIDELRERDPGEPLPAVILVAEFDDEVKEYVTAPLASGGGTGVGAFILGKWPSGTTCVVGADHRIDAASGRLAQAFDGAELFHITAAEAAAHLRELAPVPDREPAVPTSRDQWDGSWLIRLSVLGPPKVQVRDKPFLLELSWLQLNLFVYLALHPDGVSRDQLTTALWPEDTGKDVHNTLRHLRSALVAASGYVNIDSKRAPFINASTTKNSAIYRIDPQLVGVDLWDYQSALMRARFARSPEDRRTALVRAAMLCGGVLAAGLDTEWIEDHRYPLTRSQADVLTQHACLIETEESEQAIELLERARMLDPDAEETYLRIIRLQLRMNRRDDARRTVRLLRQRHQELGISTETRTERLIADAFARGLGGV